MSQNENVEEPEEGNVRLRLPRVLSYEEMDRFMLSIDSLEDLLACRFMLYGGLRVDEASSLRARDVSLENRAIFVYQGKGGKDRWSPIDTATLAIANCYAKANKLKPDDPFFSACTRTLQRHVTDVIYPRAEISEASCHTLRHSCATWQLDKQIPLDVVKNNLGHSDIAITQVYLHLNIRQRSRLYHECTRFGV